MKTIKELEAEINHLSMKQKNMTSYNKSIKVETLKEVVKLINEMDRWEGHMINAILLKQKING